MEFFESADVSLDEAWLQQIAISQLPVYCASIQSVVQQRPDEGVLSGIWGEVSVCRMLINGGVRYSLPDCPCNLSWTLTQAREPEAGFVVIHLTTSRQHHELEMIDAIHTFIEDWKRGLESASPVVI